MLNKNNNLIQDGSLSFVVCKSILNYYMFNLNRSYWFEDFEVGWSRRGEKGKGKSKEKWNNFFI